MKYLKQAIIAGALAFATLNVATAAPILDISTDGNRTLLGASGVNVDGTLYDVTFGDGTYGLGSITAFTNAEGAVAASLALLNQVLLNDYATLILNTNGCNSQLGCYVETPFSQMGGSVFIYAAFTSPSSSGTQFATVFDGDLTNNDTSFTLARWTVSSPAAAVPEPEAYAMMFAGFGLLGFVVRRRIEKAAV